MARRARDQPSSTSSRRGPRAAGQDYLVAIHDPDAPYPETTLVDDVLVDEDVISAGIELGLVEPDPTPGARAA